MFKNTIDANDMALTELILKGCYQYKKADAIYAKNRSTKRLVLTTIIELGQSELYFVITVISE